ncbi:MAG: UDP-glucose 4-epimerase GalE [Oscillospiraceae bacterium]|nr:UDP-glucose 4-epimerase GalE [Candidatus Equicaccousia limihippi]
MKVLITGGTGYIGSHTCVELIESGHEVVIIDNLYNSKKEVLNRIEKITGVRPTFYESDLRDKAATDKIFKAEKPQAVIHFAGLKAVGESVQKPLMYYDNNLISTLVLCEVMKENGVKNLVFSSSATVYGTNETMPLTEDMPLGAINPYGRTKQFIEEILRDASHDNSFNTVLLRYFNPIGAHKSGLIGEDPLGIPNNLMPYIAQVAVGRLEKLSVFGNDYPTPDGTGVRDYIHVCDLAIGHVKAVEYAANHEGCVAINLGTGNGTSVLELKDAFEKASGVKIPFVIAPRRAGDPATVYADAQKAEKLLGFKAKYSIDDMCADTWRWQYNNPKGY